MKAVKTHFSFFLLIIFFINFSAAQTTSPLVQKMYNGEWPSKDEIQKNYDYYFEQAAIQAYMASLPALNVIGIRDASEAKFGKGYNILPIWKDRMNAKTLIPTPNCDVIYSMSYLDLKETGPLVVYAPPGVIGMFTDFFQRTLTDVGAAGPDRNAGGLYLLLPPDYDGHVPGGYFAFKSRTYNVFLFFRTVLAAGPNGPDTKKPVATAEMTRVYPLGATESNRPAMKFPNASPERINMMYPTDFSYWEKLKKFIDYEPVGCLDPVSRGQLASIGIIKGQPFNPDAHQKQILTDAVTKAEKMILGFRLHPEGLSMNPYYKDRKYVNVWGGVDADWQTPTYQSLKTQAGYFQIAFSSAPAMVVDAIGMGSKYPNTYIDSEGNFLNGSNSYKLHLPPNIPASLYWAVTAYNPQDGTMPETSQPFPSRNQFDKVKTNSDGSVDLYFGPSKPSASPSENWIQTLPNRALLVAVRLYGTGSAFYDQTWKPDDLVKIK
ncbi:hypothetical protein HNP37_001229 [Flavobacterium nitrogenifigens]|uniref:DUF1254 domain-containing protein n=2 Tax=Flavobacterium TaxID=237 RepID=A0A7W7IVI4_9FLAO|nr:MULTISPECIES: DUF1254 domain-containing protein [Flavobacterium]MBB4801190.1 hypothetical protein [Flavobacterium nitrogenifigens]MBB6385062.1 hypothetical protein [Flavobacterium notoginsengisoli]